MRTFSETLYDGLANRIKKIKTKQEVNNLNNIFIYLNPRFILFTAKPKSPMQRTNIKSHFIII